MSGKNPSLISSDKSHWVIYCAVLAVLGFLLSQQSPAFGENNGFDLSDTLIPRSEIYHGGPDRDGIPAIDNPHFVVASKVSFLNHNDRILGLKHKGVIRAYPVKILNYHEIVNDEIHGQSIVISYCPLCGSGMAFQPQLPHSKMTFGVSGLLYNSDMLLYDRQTESLWSQIMATAISGELKGRTLHMLPLINTSWANWLERYPDSTVLSIKTGYWRNYNHHPYGDYDINRALYFPVANTNTRYHPKERVIAITMNNKSKVYPFSELAKQRKAVIQDEFAGKQLFVHYNAEHGSAAIYDASQRPLAATTLFWFAWVAFNPDTEVYSSNKVTE